LLENLEDAPPSRLHVAFNDPLIAIVRNAKRTLLGTLTS